MKTEKTFYITTTLPYVNAPLHLGHATEIIRADVVARFKKLQGYEVFFNTGTDEHGLKIYEAAEKSGQSIEEYTDYYAKLFKKTLEKFGISKDTHYIRTTDENHIMAAQEFWKRCANNGFIEKKLYKAKYCVGCEEEKTDSELEGGKCPLHPDREIEIIEEENYFFKFSEFGDMLLKYYQENSEFIVPEYRMNEMKEFIKRGLNDFSISRIKEKMPWGVPVPDDPEHVMYVWFDALTNYISTLGWPEDTKNFEKFWQNGTPTQYCGKDNTRFQGVMWQAMLMAAGLPLTKKIAVNGFILGEGGVKMSKSLGNVVNPLDLIDQYGTDGLRYFVLREFSSFEDSAASADSLKEVYNANLANGLGNVVSRVLKMSEDHLEDKIDLQQIDLIDGITDAMNKFNHQKATDLIWQKIAQIDEKIAETEPFKLIKTDKEKAIKIIQDLRYDLAQVAYSLKSFLPETAEKIEKAIKENKKPEPLFLRIK